MFSETISEQTLWVSFWIFCDSTTKTPWQQNFYWPACLMNEVESSWLGKEQQNSTVVGKLEQCQIFKSFFTTFSLKSSYPMLQTEPCYMQHLRPMRIWPILPITNKMRCNPKQERDPYLLTCSAEPVPRNNSTSSINPWNKLIRKCCDCTDSCSSLDLQSFGCKFLKMLY